MISRNAFRDIALAHLIGLLKSGEVRAGMQLPSQDAIAATLGLSRTAVRDAYQVLQEKGMAEIRPKTGACIAPADRWKLFDPDVVRWRAEIGPDRRFIRDLLDLRAFVEPKAAKFAAERATASDRREIEEAFEQMARPDRPASHTMEWDIAFHKRIVLASDNQFLVHFVPVLEEALRITINLSIDRTREQFDIPLHREILLAIQGADPERTERAANKVIEKTSSILSSITQTQDDANRWYSTQKAEETDEHLAEEPGRRTAGEHALVLGGGRADDQVRNDPPGRPVPRT